MRLRWLAVLTLAAVLAPRGAAEDEAPAPPPDVLAQALERMGIAAADLGYRPLGHWARYPQPSTVPYVLPFFEDLLAHPLDTYEFTRTLGNAVEDLLTPEKLRTEPDALYRLGVLLGTDRRIGGFRGYGANLDAQVEAEEPLYHALVRLLDRSGAVLSRGVAFGQEPSGPHPLAKLREDVAKVPEPLRRPLAKLVLDLVDAREWIDRGLRRVPLEMREAVFETLPDLAESTPDGTRYFPVLDDVARLVDEHSLHYGCLKALRAVQDARRAIGDVAPEDHWPDFRLRLPTPWGTVAFESTADDPFGEEVVDPLVVVRWGQADSFEGRLGATDAHHPLSVALVFPLVGVVGHDVTAEEPGAGRVASVASGILGCGIVYAAGETRNHWAAEHWGLGAGLFGMGVLVDEGGDDTYTLAAVGEGAGYFGSGLLLDAAGNDTYRLTEGDGQGVGFPGGIGILADRSGNDAYFSEPEAAKAGRADYHSAGEIAASNAQGMGCGRRGDGTDGHAWAGGLGALLDVDGDDRYEAGNFSQGLGYWYGTGLLWDGGGNDEYRSVYFTQGSGAHFAIGALVDEGGDDVHVLGHNAGAAFGFGWDVVNAFLIDRGDGSDRYEAKMISFGVAEVRSNAFFLDEGGDDTYVYPADGRGFGDVDVRPEYAAPGRTHAYPFHLPQVGVFLDLGGRDTYERRGKDGAAVEAGQGDGRAWNLRARDPASRAGFDVSVGMDVERGRLGFLDPWSARGR